MVNNKSEYLPHGWWRCEECDALHQETKGNY